VIEADEQGNPVTGGVFAIDVDGGTPRRLSPDVSSPGPPRFSPDGSQVLFNRNEAGHGGSSLWVVPVDGGEPSGLFEVPSDASAFNADWSPDGSQVVFEYFENGWDRNELRVANIDGSDMRTIWRGPSHTSAETPDWVD
jgi:Tol biopolymer transport system component